MALSLWRLPEASLSGRSQSNPAGHSDSAPVFITLAPDDNSSRWSWWFSFLLLQLQSPIRSFPQLRCPGGSNLSGELRCQAHTLPSLLVHRRCSCQPKTLNQVKHLPGLASSSRVSRLYNVNMASQQNQKKPRLSLQIKTSPQPSARPRVHINPQDPTAFNTLSNSYVTAIERSTPLTAINTLAAFSLNTPVEYQDPKNRVTTPYVAKYPESPISANPMSPQQLMQIRQFPSSMTATPPLSGAADSESKVFTFSSMDVERQPQPQPQPQHRQQPRVPSLSIPIDRNSSPHNVAPYRTATQALPPYSQPRSLQGILRNSPLPPKTAIPPPSPRRQSLRLAEKAARRVCYNSPIEQEIITNKYTKSHIDLLAEEASPNTSGLPESTTPDVPSSDMVLDTALAFTPNELQDGGQTPGPFEETRRRMAGSVGPGSPSSPAGIRKRKKKEKKRRWVWTIGQADEEDNDEEVGGAVAALRAEAARKKKLDEDDARTPRAPVPTISYSELPTPSVESSDSWSQSEDVEMTDCSSVTSEDDRLSVPPSEPELDPKTPTATTQSGLEPKRDTPIPSMNDERRDTPVPSQMDKRDTPVPPEYQ